MPRALAASALAVALAIAACDASAGTPSPAASQPGDGTGTAAASARGTAGSDASGAPTSGTESTPGTDGSGAPTGGAASPSPSAEPAASAEPSAARSVAPTPSAAASPTPSAGGSPAAAAREYQAPEDLEEGQCFSPILDADDDFLLAAILRRCDEPHRAEVFAIERLEGNAGTPYPGDEAIDEQADAACDRAFEAYVGIPYDESRLRAIFYAPTEQTWPGGDRRVTCVVEAGGEPLTASVRGSRR